MFEWYLAQLVAWFKWKKSGKVEPVIEVVTCKIFFQITKIV